MMTQFRLIDSVDKAINQEHQNRHTFTKNITKQWTKKKQQNNAFIKKKYRNISALSSGAFVNGEKKAKKTQKKKHTKKVWVRKKAVDYKNNAKKKTKKGNKS